MRTDTSFLHGNFRNTNMAHITKTHLEQLQMDQM